MTLNFELNRQDVVAGIRSVSNNRKWLLGIITVGLILWGWKNVQAAISEGGTNAAFMSVLPTAIVLIVVIGLVRLSPYLSGQKVALRPVQWRLSDEGVHIQSSVADSEIKWDAFIKYRETNRLFLLYVQKNLAQVIPKRILDEAQLIELRELISSHVKKA